MSNAHVPLIKATTCPQVDELRLSYSLIMTSSTPSPPGVLPQVGVAVGFTEFGYLGRCVDDASSGGMCVAIDNPFVYQYEISAITERGQRSISPVYFFFPASFAAKRILVTARAIVHLSDLPVVVCNDLRTRLIPAWNGAEVLRGRDNLVQPAI